MTCISPPELDQLDLLMFLDREADDSVVQHLHQCEHCHGNAESLANLENRTLQHLYRITCPNPNALRDFHYGFTESIRAKEIKKHLDHCPHCTREFVSLK